ncbi:hypothetical protein K469DRAFT_616151 [Zopfia rhizophila CBS 207.26]|uniref:MI domain-containing protein n=1 Tax=Zopfia rhizophila CBS 207.26 TaxID=1314779 RepID=A0A6A6EW89_9PEZI|nr:hypothetical protein K469DRAFT_616151 [Zopfia rhizophila CBS 207.26]
MRRPQFGGPKLPKELRDQLGDPAHRGKGGRGCNGPLNRKERRKAERLEKKVQRRQTRGQNVGRFVQHGLASEEEEEFNEETLLPRPALVERDPQRPLKGILKNTQQNEKIDPDKELSPPPRPRVSQAVKDRLVQDDAEIAALEKKLGIKGKQLKGDDEDGLGNLLGDLGVSDSDEDADLGGIAKRKRPQDDDWLSNKRRKALGIEPAEVSSDESDMGNEIASDSEEEEVLEDSMEEGSDFDVLESEEDEFDHEVESVKPRIRENPYVAPISSASTHTPAKYIPPSLRAPPASDVEALIRLKRQVQGLLNRLSEANLLTILKDIEQVYQNNARGYVNTILVDLLIGLLADETKLMDTFLILHAGFIAAVYKIIGTDFGAQMVERIVSEFDKHCLTNKDIPGKQASNLMSLVAELYNFQIIGSNLVFDYVKLFLDELSEINTELLLRIVKISGSQLRQDDPSSLKDIVLLLQKSVANVGGSNLPVRTKFMIETINNLKNNRMKTGVNASAIVSEHTTRMRKTLGSLNSRNLKGTEPLRIGLADIRDREKKGKWWLVGASWRNSTQDQISAQKGKDLDLEDQDASGVEDEGEVDLLRLAQEQRMNTNVRRAIFLTLMSASDFKDAHIHLLKLNLKKSQELEIPRVIVHCAGCEKNYNPYYTLVARKFCSEHKLKKSFQFALWDIFKSLGEKRDEEGGSDEENDSKDEMSLRKLVNFGKLYGTLIANGGLPISSLKPLNFPYLQPKTKTLVEIILVTAILQSQKGVKEGRDEKKLLNIFVQADTAPQMVAGLQYFLRKVVSKTDITANKGEKDFVKWACKPILETLVKLAATRTLSEA